MTKLRIAAIAALPLALAVSACDEAAMGDLQTSLGMKPEAAEQPEAPAAPPQPPAVSPLDQPIEIAGSEQVAAVTADSKTLNTAAFVARGNEPFWIVEASGDKAIYKTPENQNGRSINVRRLTFAKGIEYIGVLGDQPFALTVRSAACVDSMSGEKFPMSATLKVGGRINNGCATPADAAKPAAAGDAAAAAEAEAATAAANG